jgi:hypothetical protein
VSTDPAEGPDRPRDRLRETYRQQLRASIGGWTGTLITALPTVVFVVVNAITTLRSAIFAALGTAVLLAGYRLARRQSPQQAIAGLIGVAVAAAIAARTGQARGYFLVGIWTSFAYAVPFAVSVIVRRPLIGLLWEFLDPTPGSERWFRRRPLLRAYTVATLFGTAVFLARGIVQLVLYGHNATGWLAFAKIAMGYPLYIAAVAGGYWVARRARARVSAAEGPRPTEAADPVVADAADDSADDALPDRRLGLG